MKVGQAMEKELVDTRQKLLENEQEIQKIKQQVSCFRRRNMRAFGTAKCRRFHMHILCAKAAECR